MIGEGAVVESGLIEDSVVLPGAKVNVAGHIRHVILAGAVTRDEAIENEVVWGE